MRRLSLAFRAFFALLFRGEISDELRTDLGLASPPPAAAPAPRTPSINPSDGALQMLGILQRDARLLDFFMEDISAFDDAQVGAAVRNLHQQCQETLRRYLTLEPVIDGVEGSFTQVEASAANSGMCKLLGNVPSDGRVPGGILRHKGWRASSVDLPPLGRSNPKILAPAEIEVE